VEVRINKIKLLFLEKSHTQNINIAFVQLAIRLDIFSPQQYYSFGGAKKTGKPYKA